MGRKVRQLWERETPETRRIDITRCKYNTPACMGSTKMLSCSVKRCVEGYPHLAAFLDTSDDFMLYRRFGFLQARILLNKQDELRVLELDLDHMDSVSTPDVLQSRETDVYMSDKRKNLLVKIEEKFKEYGKTSYVLLLHNLLLIVEN